MQEDEPGTYSSIRQIALWISISKSSVHRLVKKNDLHCYKRLKTPRMNSANRKRRAQRAGKLVQRFFIQYLPLLMFQDEKKFFFQVPTNRQNNRFISMVPRKMDNWIASTVKETNIRKRLWYPL